MTKTLEKFLWFLVHVYYCGHFWNGSCQWKSSLNHLLTINDLKKPQTAVKKQWSQTVFSLLPWEFGYYFRNWSQMLMLRLLTLRKSERADIPKPVAHPSLATCAISLKIVVYGWQTSATCMCHSVAHWPANRASWVWNDRNSMFYICKADVSE